MSESNNQSEQPIVLSDIAEALLKSIKAIKPRENPDDTTRLSVSQTVSLLAIMYERIRNAVEYREDHLLRRAAIERILRRRLALNPEAKGESENILRELMWARYFPNGSLDDGDIHTVQAIIDKYLDIKRKITPNHTSKMREYLTNFIVMLMTCEIEETLSPDLTAKYASYTYFIFQTLKQKIKIDGVTEEQKDTFFLIAVEKSYRRSDRAYDRYHLFTTFYQPISKYKKEELDELAPKLVDIFRKIDIMLNNPYNDRLVRFVRKQLPPFLILFELLSSKIGQAENILTHKDILQKEVEALCIEKYKSTQSRIQGVAIKSLIYIFFTKMLLAIILEYPISLYFFNEINYVSIGINTIFPPILMMIIVFFTRTPGPDNTQRIFQRLVDIIDKDKTFETRVALITKKNRVKNPIMIFGFTIFYSLTFFIVILLIYEVLTFLNFNIASQVIFVFFVSVVSFFSYRIRQVANTYRLIEKQGVLSPLVDFFMLPMISIGKFLSNEIGRFNVLIVIFDFILDAPFKLVIEIVEEWISFVRARKEEIM